jgi:hypothetical protein
MKDRACPSTLAAGAETRRIIADENNGLLLIPWHDPEGNIVQVMQCMAEEQ